MRSLSDYSVTKEGHVVIRRFFLGLCLMSVAGCNNSEQSEEIAQLSQQVWELERSLERTEQNLESTRSSVWNVFDRLASLENEYITAELDPGEPTFQFVRAGALYLTISVQGYEAHSDGQKVTFTIGNPYSAKLENVKIKCVFGPREPKFEEWTKENLEAHSSWNESLRTKEKRLLEPIEPGMWNTFTMVLAPAKPEEIALLRVSAECSSISMQQHP